MVDWIKNLFINKGNSETPEWRTDTSIFNFLINNLNADGRLQDSAGDLPDEKPVDENELRFAPGLLDSMFGITDSEESKLEVDELVRLLKHISEYGDKKSEAKFYQVITSTDSVIGIIDDFLEKAINLSLPFDPYLFDFSKDLAFKTNHRNSVKFGVALIGICNGKSVAAEIRIIGLHDEFTLFAIAAISNFSDNIVNDLWEFAKKVDGWGKIHAVERLAKMELPDTIKDWLITDGYKNSIMYEYLAYTCAVNGELHEVLEKKTISNSVFKASDEIIAALITGGPAEDISHYQYASILIENFVRHATTHANDISTFIVLNQIKDFLVELQRDIAGQSKNGWTQDIISNCLIDIVEILNGGNWSELVVVALKSSDNVIYWKGKQAAKMLNVDLWEIVWQKLKDNPSESKRWYDVVDTAKPEQVDEIIRFVMEAIPLKELATGPRDSFGFGPEFDRYQSFGYVITFLEEYPGKGEVIILAALDSPVTSNRNMAIKVLHRWGKVNWSENISTKLQRLSNIEPNIDTKGNILRILRGQDLSY
ncbi:MAG TPA: hypothetical protein VGN20_23685 [Mucilaginibacter sp.]|jgi:hypothetical protein